MACLPAAFCGVDVLPAAFSPAAPLVLRAVLLPALAVVVFPDRSAGFFDPTAADVAVRSLAPPRVAAPPLAALRVEVAPRVEDREVQSGGSAGRERWAGPLEPRGALRLREGGLGLGAKSERASLAGVWSRGIGAMGARGCVEGEACRRSEAPDPVLRRSAVDAQAALCSE